MGIDKLIERGEFPDGVTMGAGKELRFPVTTCWDCTYCWEGWTTNMKKVLCPMCGAPNVPGGHKQKVGEIDGREQRDNADGREGRSATGRDSRPQSASQDGEETS